LLHIDGFGQDQVCTNPKSFGDTSLSFHNCNGQGRLVRGGISRTFEKQSRILLVVAVHHNRVEVLRHQFLDSGERFAARLDGKIQIAQNMRH